MLLKLRPQMEHLNPPGTSLTLSKSNDRADDDAPAVCTLDVSQQSHQRAELLTAHHALVVTGHR